MGCARTIADRVAILNDGIIGFEGTIETMEHADDQLVQSPFLGQ
jgi:ABC-type transporter Mla maintaining outer membrane lipid asymmetry ATPase subunit MlaF